MRKYFIAALIALITLPAMAQKGEIVKLPTPKMEGGMPLMEALKNRETTREFSSQKFSLQDISNLLWAADGVNRENGKRTAPNSMNRQEIDIYIATIDGIYRYNPHENSLTVIAKDDLRGATGKQAFVKDAPLNLVYVADFSRVPDGETEGQTKASHTNCGFIAQNVYLYCTSENMACVVRGYFDEKEIAKAFKLSDKQKAILTQTVGRKK